ARGWGGRMPARGAGAGGDRGPKAGGAAGGGPPAPPPAAGGPATHAGSAMRSTAASAFSRRRTQRRATHGNRRGGQSNRYLAHHDAHSIRPEHPSLSESNSAVSDELQRCGTVARIRLQIPSRKDAMMNAR